jgi:hypothetical protein
VQYTVEKPVRFTRVQLLLRLAAFVVLGVLGVSLGSLFVLALVALPVVAAIRTAGRTAEEYLAVDGRRIARGLHWFAAIYGWFGLVTERLPSHDPEETVRLQIDRSGKPTPRSALLRLLLGLPSALVLALLGAVASIVWLWAAICVLVNERIGDATFAFLAGVQRWGVRLLAYQAALVDAYPPFSFEDVPRGQLTDTSGVVPPSMPRDVRVEHESTAPPLVGFRGPEAPTGEQSPSTLSHGSA